MVNKDNDIKLLKLRFKKSDFDVLTSDEQVFVTHLTCLLTETMILKKLLLISGNNLHTKKDLYLTASRVQSLFFLRLLASKLYEGWNILQNSFFRRPHPDQSSLKDTYEPKLSDQGKKALDEIRKYFGRGDTLLEDLRNKYSFHYDRKKIADTLKNFNKDAEFEIILAEEAGNCMYVFSDNLVAMSILDSIDAPNHQTAMDILYRETFLVAGWFDRFSHAILELIIEKCGYEDEDLLLQDVPCASDFDIPFFLTRPDNPFP